MTTNINKSVGGKGALKEETILRCLGRMRAWIRLAVETVKTEFPDFDVLNAFEIFDVSGARDTLSADRLPCEQVKMLGRACKVDPQALLEAYTTMLPIAINKKNNTAGATNVDAWGAAFEHIQKSRKMTDKLKVRPFHAQGTQT